MSQSPRKNKTPPAPQNNNSSSARDTQVLDLLNALGDRLIRSEKERVLLTSSVKKYETQFSEMQNRITKLGKTQEEQDRKLEKAEHLTKAIEDALQQQNRLARRLEKMTQDKVRLIRKLERIEETVIETREALNSKALVLLTDQGVGGSALPMTPDTVRAAPTGKAIDRPIYWQAACAVSLVALAIMGGWAYTQLPPKGMKAPLEIVSAPISTPIEALQQNAVSPAAPVPSTDEERLAAMEATPDALAASLNSITPGIPTTLEAEQQAAATTTAALAPQDAVAQPVVLTPPAKDGKLAADEKIVADFLATQSESTPLNNRVTADLNLPAVVKEIEAKALKGTPEAQHDLAAIYTAGHGGVQIDYTKAAFWFKEAALQGIANARYNLGVLHHQGLGVEKNVDTAIGWYRAAAILNHPEAEYNLGIAYIEGIGTPYDPARAADYFTQAANAGVVEAAYNLGLIYENGLLPHIDPAEALPWYKKAADKGSPEAATALRQLAKSLNVKIDTIKSDKKAALEIPAVKSSRKAPVTEAGTHQTLVAQIQEQLIHLGLYPGPADGHMDAITQDAIRSYQGAQGLERTGQASQDLLVALLTNEQTTDTGMLPPR